MRPILHASVAMALGVTVMFASPGFNAPLFPNPVIPGSSEPWDMFLADVDEDGLDDLIVPGFDSSYTMVLLNNGDGTFRRKASFTGSSSGGAVADFDEDNHLDLVVAGGGSGVFVLPGNGDGTFGDGTVGSGTYYSGTGSFSFGVVTGDFDEDNHQDLAFSYYYSGGIYMLLGDGNGGFSAPVSFNIGNGIRLRLGDFNEDNDLDLAYSGNYNAGLAEGNGDGTLAAGVNLGSEDDRNGLAIQDIDGDTHEDIVVATADVADDVSVYLGNGDGTFAPETRYTVGNEPWDVNIADLDDDGEVDLIVGNQQDAHLSFLKGNGDGSFQSEVQIPTFHSNGQVEVSDFDGDGRVDLAVASTIWDEFTLLLGHGDGTFPAPDTGAVYSPASLDVAHSAFADLDKNGLLDVVLLIPSSNLAEMLVADGSGGFSLSDSDATGTGAIDVAIDDLNNDTNLDVVVVNGTSEDGTVFLGQGNGSFDLPITTSLRRQPRSIALGKFDGDANVDAAVVSTFGSPMVFSLVGSGSGIFGHVLDAQPVGLNPTTVEIGDFDENGRPDLVVGNQDSADLSVLLGNGDGTFSSEVRYTLGLTPPAGGSILVADLDQDGHQDLYMAPDRVILYGVGDGTFGAPVQQTGTWFELHAAVGDVTGDQRLDLVSGGTKAHVRPGQLDGQLGPEQFFAIHGIVRGVAVDDTNSDGHNDLIFAGINGVTALLNKGTTVFEFSGKTTMVWPEVSGAVSYNVYRGAISDLVDTNQDGLPDSGYGDCQNTLDPDTTDAQYVDAQIPISGDGFFYLAAVLDWEGERDLGTTSGGLQRQPTTPCP